MSQQFFEQLFEHSQQVSPFLVGSIGHMPAESLQLGANDGEKIKQLYQNIAKANPEAGSAYWLTRTWDLLCWQPVYVAFLSIYGFKTLPDIARMGQSISLDGVAGFQFSDRTHTHGDEETLIPQAGEGLRRLFEHYREAVSEWTRIRPGFTRHLFADLILASLVKLQQFLPHIPSLYLREQGRLWLDACQLPMKLLDSLRVDPRTDRLSLVRTSCCLVYKCEGQALCLDCPRHPQNRA
ncbi:siderophore ferric iron reductase [Thaumasiovibrio subtropicus]|uniref:siderophore ferric iron reductase n=1 Tax=Thaumasiovibrio subtropicus TaxID=1891207 RepID=UPI000B34DB01|nr:siderophore ferric iron reductase [Thaumasiovibrio subtropicus]